MGRIEIAKGSITEANVDAIVNAANEGLRAGGGVCGAIFEAAGYHALQAACDEIGHCSTGDAAITPGFALKAKYVIHAVGPIWKGGHAGEELLLASCYKKAIALAVDNGCGSIAFPLISSGIFGYPKEEAWRVAIRACLEETDRLGSRAPAVTFCVVSDDALELGRKTLAELANS